MPSELLINEYVSWFAQSIALTYAAPSDSLISLPNPGNLCDLDVTEIQAHQNSHLWRFRTSGLIVRKTRGSLPAGIHLVNATSGAISLKDVGIMNVLLRVTGAGVSAIFSPKGISEEVRLVQADPDISDRLFTYGTHGKILLLPWQSENNSVIKNAIVPIEFSDLLKSQRFQ
jgi:hypothetical protein